jgi:NAD(P)-dependent dehydrogenase (short-subunit alcohol dehydrogenase family)
VTGLAAKVALVTGASHGTGVDIARCLAEAGARVAVHYRADRAAALEVARRITAEGGTAAVVGADLARTGDVERLLAEVRDALGSPLIVVNNAGPFNGTPFRRLAEADWDYVMNANLRSVYTVARLVADGMAEAGWGRIVNVGATSGLVRSHGVYGLAKAALLHLTQALALELAPTATVNAVVPSQIASPRTDTLAAYKAAAIAATPMGRLVTQEEIARMVVRLCSPEFDFVTGQAIVMDGGRALPRFPALDVVQD